MAFQAHSTNRVLRAHPQSGFLLSNTPPATSTPASQLEGRQLPKHLNHTKSCYANITSNSSLPPSAMPIPVRQSFPVSRPPRKDSSSSSTSCASTPTNCNSSLTGNAGHMVVNSSGSTGSALPHKCRSLQGPSDVLHSGNVPGGHAKANQKNEALLDRKAFISLEKSINWQALIDTYATDDSTEVIDNRELSSSAELDNSSSTASCSPTSLTGKATVVTQTKEFTLPGMKDVPAWLKLLRLHKYSGLFAQMSYEQMLDLNENELENRNITKGARQKLVLSIQKLKVRSHVLLASELELIDVKSGGYRKWISLAAISQAFCQIRAFLSTPIRPPILNPVPAKSSATIPATIAKEQITTPTIAVDANNNPFPQGTVTGGLDDKWAFTVGNDNIDNARLFELWLELDNEQLVDILTRMVGHLCHNLVTKCKKRLQSQNLWMKHFNEYYAMLEREDFLKKIVLNLLALKVDKSKVMLTGHTKSEDDDDDDESSDSSSSPHSTDSGVEAGDSGDDRERHYSDGGDLYTCEKEENFYSELQMILDKCLEHDAFGSHSPLFGEWHSQLSIMRSALRNQIEKTSSQAGQQAANHQTSQFMRPTPKNGHFTPQQPELGGSLGQKTFQSTNNNNIIVQNQSHKSHHHHHHHHHSQHHHSQQPSLPLPLPQSGFQNFASLQQSQHSQQPFQWSVNFNSNNLNAGHSHTPTVATTLLRQIGVISSGREVGAHKLNNNSIAQDARNNNNSNNVNKSILPSIVPINEHFNALNPQWSLPWIEKTPVLEINGGSVWSPHTSHHVQTNREWSSHGGNLVSSTELNHPLSPTIHQSQWPSSTPMDSDIERLCIQMAEDALNGTCLEDK